jgi:copper homeostasis protein
MKPRAILIEVSVESVESALAAQAGGASRLELCDNLVEGGTTPSVGMLEVVRERIDLPIFVLVRPRGGDSCLSRDELEVMQRDIRLLKKTGADGVVFGALLPDATVDRECIARLIEAARPLPVTFHRAFDLTRDPLEALETLVALGVERVLTSGQAPSALEGVETIATLVRTAEGRITILAGGGLNEANVAELVRRAGVPEVHLRGAMTIGSPMTWRNERVKMGKAYSPDEYARTVTDVERIRRVVAALG